MDASQIIRRAEEMGIEPGSVGEADLIRAIQRAEGNVDCYATDRNKTCGEERCLWRQGCLKAKKEVKDAVTDLSFIIRQLRNSAAILSLISENARKHFKDGNFLRCSFEALAEQVKNIHEVIEICSNINPGGKTTSHEVPSRKSPLKMVKKNGILTARRRF